MIFEKPLSEMSLEEMQTAIESLRGAREALRNEAIQQKAVREAKGIKEPKVAKPKKEKIVDPLMTDMLAFLRGDKET